MAAKVREVLEEAPYLSWFTEDFEADPRLIPGAVKVDDRALPELISRLPGVASIAICQAAPKRSQGAAAWLRAEGCLAEYLEGGFEAWKGSDLPLIRLMSDLAACELL